MENAYLIGNVDAYGLCCRTNITSNTAFRGFGAPQAMFAVETVIKHTAEEFGFDADKVSSLKRPRLITVLLDPGG